MNIMKKQIFLQENILKTIINISLIFFLFSITCITKSYAKEKWFIDQNLSNITFEVPVLFATNVIGKFNNINGLVELDLENKENNKAIISVSIDSIESNYEKYKDLLLGPIFFDSKNFPIALMDTKKFYYEDETDLTLNIELTIKDKSKIIETNLNIIKLTNDIVQILANFEFSRTDFKIGTGNWQNTTILRDKIKIDSNIFLVRE